MKKNYEYRIVPNHKLERKTQRNSHRNMMQNEPGRSLINKPKIDLLWNTETKALKI